MPSTPLTIEPSFTLRDRIAIRATRWLGKPGLAIVGNGKILRALSDTPMRWLGGPPKGSDVTKDPDGSLWVRLPDLPPDAPWMMYLHGGGFMAGSPHTHLHLACRLAARAGMHVFIPRYGLAPEHPFPRARDDLRAHYKNVVDTHGRLGALCGDSAGGNLALMLTQFARDTGLPQPKAMGLLSPVADLSEDIDARMQQTRDEMLFPTFRLFKIRDTYLQGHAASDPEVSPLRGELGGLPPTLIQASAVEAAAPDAVALGEKMDEVRVELWEGLPHVWQIFAGFAPVADRAVQTMADYLKAHQ